MKIENIKLKNGKRQRRPRRRTQDSALSTQYSARGGFTLVEMLIAVGLVVLMMTLFATIFQMATGAMGTQKGNSENDQRVRLVLSLLRSDLNGDKFDKADPTKPKAVRTFRNVIPWGPDENLQPGWGALQNFSSIDRVGYLSISENDPDNDTDDVLSLTVSIPSTASERYYGRAAGLFPDIPAGNYGPLPNPPPAPPAPPTVAPPGNYWPNQPEFDDVLGAPNQAGTSTVAEVSYFLRAGTLYRRVMLVRTPNGAVTPTPLDGAPRDMNGAPLNTTILYNPAGGPRNFWSDFDYSAFFNQNANFPPVGLRFHGTGNVQQDSLPYNGSATPTNPFVLGNPAYRFGFDNFWNNALGIPGPTYGLPREYVWGGAGVNNFIGRFTQRETSDPNFGYPGSLAGASGDPMTLGTQLNLDIGAGSPTFGVVTNYSTGGRASEDVLMTNVHKFDIKVWDPAASYGPDGAPGVAGVDDDTNGFQDSPSIPANNPRPFNPQNDAPDLGELGWPGSDDGDFRDIGHHGFYGFYNAKPQNVAQNPINFNPQPPTLQSLQAFMNVPVTMYFKPASFPPAAGATADYSYPNLYYSPGQVNSGSLFNGVQIYGGSPFFFNRYDTWHPSLNLWNNGGGTPISDCPPYRPFNFGADGRPGKAGVDDDGNGSRDFITLANGQVVPDPREIGYPGTDDQPVPLGAIQIKISFFDRTSNQLREVTFVQSLLYTP